MICKTKLFFSQSDLVTVAISLTIFLSIFLSLNTFYFHINHFTAAVQFDECKPVLTLAVLLTLFRLVVLPDN